MGARALRMKAAPAMEVAPVNASVAAGTAREEGRQPELEAHRGSDINGTGRIAASAATYADAVASGMNLRSRPIATAEHVIARLRYGTRVFVRAADTTGDWYFVVATDGTAGWIGRAYVATDMPDLTTILKERYVDTGLWKLSTGNDYTTLVTAVAVANRGRRGVSFDAEKYREYKDSWGIGGAVPIPWRRTGPSTGPPRYWPATTSGSRPSATCGGCRSMAVLARAPTG